MDAPTLEIEHYRVVYVTDAILRDATEELQRRVENHLGAGFRLYGNLTMVIRGSENPLYALAQTMVK